jgi:hypothetical protein
MQINVSGKCYRFASWLLVVLGFGLGCAWAQADPNIGNEPKISFEKTSLGFYKPLGTVGTPSSCGSFLGQDTDHGGCYKFSGTYHTGMDILASYGSPVFAIASGVVADVNTSPTWGPGLVAVMILHTLNDGTQFIALYGHVVSGLQKGDLVSGGVQFAYVGHYEPGNPGNDHLHFAIHPNPTPPTNNLGNMDYSHWPGGTVTSVKNLVETSESQANFITNGFVDPADFINGANEPWGASNRPPTCQNGSSERYLPGGQIPIHPDGTIVKIKGNDTAYVLRSGQRLAIPDRQTLNTLYGFGRGFDFRDLITISPQELSLYEDGGVVRSALPNNGRNEPDGRLIRQWGGVEISIVTQYNGQDGFRMPFATGSAFLNLGYAECNVAGVSDYGPGYPPPSGLVVENMSRGIQAAGGVDPNYVMSSFVSPNPPSSGQSATITVNVTNNGGTANDKIVDIEVYDPTGSRVLQQSFEHQFFTGGTPIPYNVNWIAGPTGSYAVKVGIFTSGWTSLDTWNDNALSINVGGSNPPTSYQLDIWWPTDGTQVSGTQPFKALVSGMSLSAYVMYWQVDGGQLNLMSDSTVDAPHKEASVDLTGWTWRGNGPYTVNFVAKDLNGNLLVQRSSAITVIH